MPPEKLPELDPAPFLKAGIPLRRQIPLSRLGTFQLGGAVNFLVDCQNPENLPAIRKLCLRGGIKALLIGEGSNLLFSDDGWPGLLVRYAEGTTEPSEVSPGKWLFSAAMNLQKAVDWATEHGFAGLEAFNGIPGTLGGAVVGNAGAWGVQMEHVLQEILGVDTEGLLYRRTVEECGFSYRDSKLKHEDFWVSEVVLNLQPGNKTELAAERKRILALRAARHPDLETTPCIGSFFKNLEPSSAAERRQAAGYFLEQAGAKSRQVGGAGVYSGHANILIKKDPDCKAEDVAALARDLQAAVKKKHGIELVREVRYLGKIPGEPGGEGFY